MNMDKKRPQGTKLAGDADDWTPAGSGSTSIPPSPSGCQAGLGASIAYHDAGLTVIPLRRQSKRPLVAWSEYQATPPDRDTVTTWARRWPGCNWAVLLGPPSAGLIALDFDDANSYARWAAAWPDVAQAAPTVGTARGAHVYLVGPAGQRTASMENYAGEVKGAGGYVLLPPSIHPSGAVYQWRHGDLARWVPDVDDLRQIGVMVKTPAVQRAPSGRPFPTNRTPSRLKPCAAAVIGGATPTGQRNVTAWRLALHLRSEGWSEAGALYILSGWWDRSAVPGDGVRHDVDLARTVASAYNRLRNPGHGCASPELSPYCESTCPLARFRSATS